MSCHDKLSERVRELTAEEFKEFEQRVVQGADLVAPNAAFEKRRDKLRREFISSIGIDQKKYDRAVESDNRRQEAELKAFLGEYRSKSADRRPAPSVSRDIATHASALAEAGHQILPVFDSSIFAGDRATLAGIAGLPDDHWTDGAINSGWVFPEDPSRIRIKDGEHNLSLCWPNDYRPSPEFVVRFAFIPATTGTYEMTAVIAFHGFYVLVSDDSFWNCRFAKVKLTAQTRVHQYVSTPWKDHPPLLDVEKQNTSEVTNFDRTFFLDQTAALRAGDPVIFTVKGVVYGFSHGGGTRAELNFEAGTSNYIEPQFLSVVKL